MGIGLLRSFGGIGNTCKGGLLSLREPRDEIGLLSFQTHHNA